MTDSAIRVDSDALHVPASRHSKRRLVSALLRLMTLMQVLLTKDDHTGAATADATVVHDTVVIALYTKKRTSANGKQL